MVGIQGPLSGFKSLLEQFQSILEAASGIVAVGQTALPPQGVRIVLTQRAEKYFQVLLVELHRFLVAARSPASTAQQVPVFDRIPMFWA